VDLSIYPKDLPLIQIGQNAVIVAGDVEAQGKISYVQPLVSEETRRTFARVVLDNRNGAWRPGLFVSGKVATGQIDVPLQVTRSALQSFGGETVVFVQEEEGFEPRPVTLGRGDDSHVEIVAGLKPGERYVETGSFLLKAELQKGEAEHEH
jgi:cobalt-zinc-cadmium efflux system membrane fusion protein